MPGKTTQAAGFNIDASLASHATDTTDYGQDFSRLPGGISGAIAQLQTATIGTYKSGELAGKEFVRFAGMVQEPEVATEIIRVWEPGPTVKGTVKIVSTRERQIRGLMTSLMIPLCDSRSGTADDNIKEILNEMRKLGGPEFTADIKRKKDLIAKLAALEEIKPFFKFSTSDSDVSKEYPKQRVWEDWYGSVGLENYQAAPAANGVNDQTGNPASPAASSSGSSFDEFGDLDSLAEKAAEYGEDDDNPEGERLKEMALEAGLSEDDVAEAADWAGVVAKIKEARGEGESGEDKPEEKELKKGTVVGYKPPSKGPGGKILPGKKRVDCEITAIDKKKGTVDLLNQVDKKTKYLKVKINELEVD